MNNSLHSNNFHIFEHTKYKESNLLKDTQKQLKEIEKGEYIENDVRKLPGIMLRRVVKSIMESETILDSLCSGVQDWCISSSNNLGDVDMEFKNLNWKQSLLERLRQEGDFLKFYTFQNEGMLSIWIIVKSADYNTNKRYFRIKRSLKMDDIIDEEFEFLIFDKEEEEEVEEQISYLCEGMEVFE